MLTTSRFWQSIVIVIIYAIFSTGCGWEDVTPAKHITKANEMIDNGDLNGATIELKNALSKDPRAIEARWLLGKVSLENGDGASAEKEVRKALELGLKPSSAYPLIIKAIFLQEDFNRLLLETENMSSVLPAMSIGNRALVLGLRGQSYLAKREFEKAKDVLDHALEIDTNSRTALVGMAKLYIIRKDYVEARRRLQSITDSDPSDPDAWSLLGEIEMAEGNLEQAETAFSRAIELKRFASNESIRRALVRALLGNYSAAAADIQDLERRGLGDHPLVNYVEGYSYLLQNKYQEAGEAFEASLRTQPSFLQAQFYLAVAHLFQGNLEQAEKLAETVQRAVPKSRNANRLLGVVLINKSDYSAATNSLRNLLRDSPNDPMVLNMLATASLLQGDHVQGVEYSRKLLSLQPDSQPAKKLLLLATVLSGQNLDADGLDGQPIASTGEQDFELDFLGALDSFKKTNFGQALERAKNLHERYPEKVEPLNLMAACYLMTGKWGKAKVELEKVLELLPNEQSAARNLAKIEVRAGDFERARALLKALIEEHPNDEEATILLAGIETQLVDSSAGIEVLEQSVERNPNLLDVRAKLANEYYRAGRIEDVLDVTGNLNSDQLKEQPILLEARGKAQMLTGNSASARQLFEHLVDVNPKSASYRYLLADSLLKSGEVGRAQNEFTRAAQLDPLYFPARLGEVSVLTEQGDTEHVRAMLARLRQDFGDRPEVLGIEGMFAMSGGDYATAEERFSMLAKLKQDTESTILYVKALAGQQKYEEAIAVMQNWLKEHSKDLSVLLHLAGGYLTLNRNEEARTTYARIIELYPDHVPALNNLAWLSQDFDLNRAINYAERANNLAPNNPQIQHTLGVLLTKRGDVSGGLNLLKKAVQNTPDNPEFQLSLGRVLVQQKKNFEARHVLNALVAKFPGSSFSNEAKTLLNTISRDQ